MASRRKAVRDGRNAILKAGIGLFARKGYAAVSVRMICETAGITKPVLYYHFGSKQNLYRQLIIDCIGEHRKDISHLLKLRGRLRSRLSNMLYCVIRRSLKDGNGTEMILRLIVTPGDKCFHLISADIDAIRALIADAFQEGIDSGELRGDPRQLATALMGFGIFAIMQNAFKDNRFLTRKNVEDFVDILLQGSKSCL